jgi:hypothetical protein
MMMNKQCSLTLHGNVIGFLCITAAFSSPAQAGGYTNCSNASGVSIHTWGNHHHNRHNYSNMTGYHGHDRHDFKTHNRSHSKHSDRWKSHSHKSTYSADSQGKNHHQNHGKPHHNFYHQSSVVIW